MDKPTLAERLKKLSQSTTCHAVLSMYLEDYCKGLDLAMGLGYFATVYRTTFHRYDENATVYLAEMIDKSVSFVPEKKAELLFHLLIEPFYFLKYSERS